MADDLGAIFRRLIRNTGPLSLTQFMGESNARYYDSRDPLGQGGDFITAPEISQMFGELIGLWLADMWINSGRPDDVEYVELGPGRATLAKDALRAAAKYGFQPEVNFVESSGALREVQAKAFPAAHFHHDLSTLPMDVPLMFVANEFLDALPVRQLVKTPEGWRERMVGLEGEDFAYVASGGTMDGAVPQGFRDVEPGTILETCPGAAATVYEVAGRLTEQGGAALFIDYGHAQLQPGSTLQAIRAHEKVDPFAEPGTADLTALVDFETLGRIAESRDVRHLGTVEQGAWLRSLGIEARAQALSAKAPHYAEEIHSAMQRLVAPDQMGSLFKVMGLAAPGWADGAGFSSD
ncbi:class I SAM-dependent methyltransferase [Parerythrobacter aestuarii]|uniref:class I SAM-dependent methyltransferase n=1 Tax=Parerythrobacter aestuarii TaxID=3020909 RepID=UPI0024DE02CE|nr:SAM-dependent methyltransferase [Parerythrobacter aestuarii]